MKFLIIVASVILISANSVSAKTKEPKVDPGDPAVLVYVAPKKTKKKPKANALKKIKAERALLTEVSQSCSFSMDNITDQRQNKDTIGHKWSAPLRVSGVDAWINAIKKEAFIDKLVEPANNVTNIQLKPALTRLYSYAQNMNLHGISALKIDIFVDQKLAETRRYRGLGSRVNWVNGAGEYHAVVGASVRDNLASLIQDLPNICDTFK